MAQFPKFKIDTVVRIKATGQFAIIKNIATLLDGTLLHYEGPIEGKPPGNYYLGNNDALDLEALPKSNLETNTGMPSGPDDAIR